MGRHFEPTEARSPIDKHLHVVLLGELAVDTGGPL